jgi:hypothetical protein
LTRVGYSDALLRIKINILHGNLKSLNLGKDDLRIKGFIDLFGKKV